MHSLCCVMITAINPYNSFHLMKQTHLLYNYFLHSFFPSVPVTHHCTFLTPVTLSYLIWVKSYNLGLSGTALFHLTSSPQVLSMLQQIAEFPFLLRQNNIPLYVYTTCFCIHKYVDGYLDCLWVLPTVNNAAMNMDTQISL